jgi:ABC-type Fe3+/spermidine/putrescine transport system ATPase subunit
VLLLDEPLGALDRALHDHLVAELGELFTAIGQTAVYVTHDVAEAFALGTRVAVMREGAIVRTATPEQLWADPGDAWTARFIGLENIEEHGAATLVTRPEGVTLRPDATGNAVVVESRRDGPVVTLRARYDDGRTIVSTHAGLRPPRIGTRVVVDVDRAAVTEVAGERAVRATRSRWPAADDPTS